MPSAITNYLVDPGLADETLAVILLIGMQEGKDKLSASMPTTLTAATTSTNSKII